MGASSFGSGKRQDRGVMEPKLSEAEAVEAAGDAMESAAQRTERSVDDEADFGELEFTAEEIAEFEAADQREALSVLFDAVRSCSSDGRLSTPVEWVEAGFVPDHMDAESFEMFVYEYLEEHRVLREAEERPAPPQRTYRTATRAVGVPQPVGQGGGEAPESAAAPDDGDVVSASVSLEESGFGQGDGPADAGAVLVEDGGAADGSTADCEDAQADAEFSRSMDDFEVPEGYELVELEGELTLVAVDDDDASGEIACDDIAVLVGKRSYYLYSKDIMTDRYAHWAFLACEDDRIVTFVECVREESRTYPRPMSIDGLKNEPFSMSDEEIAETWDAVRESGVYPDIETTAASNGDVFFYSTEYLSPAYAASLAEWHAVERGMYL